MKHYIRLIRAVLIWHGARTLTDQNYSEADKYLRLEAVRFLKTKPKIK